MSEVTTQKGEVCHFFITDQHCPSCKKVFASDVATEYEKNMFVRSEMDKWTGIVKRMKGIIAHKKHAADLAKEVRAKIPGSKEPEPEMHLPGSSWMIEREVDLLKTKGDEAMKMLKKYHSMSTLEYKKLEENIPSDYIF